MTDSAVQGMRRRAALTTGLAAAALGALLVAPSPVSAGEAGRTKPTIVLVHGAFADASSWNDVITELKRGGYPVLATANPLRGLSGDAAYLKSVLENVKGPVVLVGHSYGGAVISKAAVGDSSVRALVYVAAFLPDKGESALALSAKYPGSTLGPNTRQWTYRRPGGGKAVELTIKQDKFREQFAADVPARKAAAMAAAQRPVAVAALEERATAAAWKTIPSWALIATGDKNIPPAAQRWMARRADARTAEVDASHAVSVSRPHKVAQLILKAARAVG
ncbi:alpha/beta fold hydrolase [Nonomuraea lactucae]|uniref:alpha/beta fold hydrolase n=1 Tax=Nonomuraea lactucae TaxID=2249762 RepID=UPI001F061221|nr:alpha/beta hydrolase [Nonomuraea lactucae]